MEKYPVSIKWSDEDEGYIATIPGIQGLSAFGEEPDVALSELKIAAKAYFESLKQAGKPMPVLEKVIPFSGQLRLRMPKSLHGELSQAAKSEGVSLNTHIITLLSKRLVEEELSHTIHRLENIVMAIGSDIVSSAQNMPQSLQPQDSPENVTSKYHESERIH
jgi:predicted RNase H-like HicB family nuclease